MEYISEIKTVTFGGKSTQVHSCVKCHRYAEHFATGSEMFKCKICGTEFETEGHYIWLSAYGKIKFACFPEYNDMILKHAATNHPEYFRKRK